MTIDPMSLLKDLALSNASARVLERLHLDYCCGGNHTLADACEEAGQNLQAVAAALGEALDAGGRSAVSTQHRSMGELISSILDTHHVFTRSELLRIEGLLNKVIARHHAEHPELESVGARFAALKADLDPHLRKEKQILFPYLRDRERYLRGELTAAPAACFGTIVDPIRQTAAEHQAVGNLLRKIRQLARDFAVPADACPTYRSSYQALEALEADLMRHIH